jgi:hypothetical protein
MLTKTPEPNSASDSRGHNASIELVIFTKSNGPLTKRIELINDKVTSDGSACMMARGRAKRVTLRHIGELAALIEALESSQAIALGTLREDLPDEVRIVTKAALAAGGVKNAIARIGANLVYLPERAALSVFDFDMKGMPSSVALQLKVTGGFWAAMVAAIPELALVGRLTRLSTSAGLSRTDTGEVFPGSGGLHVYITIKDGSDAVRFLKTLHARCWLAGFGWLMVGASGQLLDRSIIDRMVGAAERLVFEGEPVVVPPLVQDALARKPVVVSGGVLDSLAACPPLSIVELARLDELKAREIERVAPERAKAHAVFVDVQTAKIVKRTKMAPEAARQVVLRQCEGILRPDVELPFDDEALAGTTVRDVLNDPARYEGETLADPLEGVPYGRCVAMIMRRADGTPWIHSFAHGRTIYELKDDAAAVRQAMEKAAKGDVVATFIRLGVAADLDPVETETLRHLAKKLSGSGLAAINAAFNTAVKQHAMRQAKAARARNAARRRDPRPLLEAPFLTAPWLPEMGVLNEVIGAVGAEMPPVRNIDDDTTRARKLPVPNMHAFTGDDPEEDDDDPTAPA